MLKNKTASRQLMTSFFIPLILFMIGAENRSESAEVELNTTVTTLKDSKKKAVTLYSQYLEVIQTRYLDEKGKFDSSMLLKDRDLANINSLNAEYLGLAPMKSDTTAGAAVVVLKKSVADLNLMITQRKIASDSEGFQFHEIHIQGEENPKNLHVATITQIKGQVELLTNPADKILTEDPKLKYAKFDGKFYTFKSASLKDSIESGDIVRIGTSNTAKARLIFNNGDHIELGPGTAFRMIWSNTSLDRTAAADLLYGRVRMIVKKGGPRSNFRVSTRSAVMGVRGTDFYLDDKTENTQIVVVRGKVSVKPKNAKLASIDVKAGFTACIPTPANTAETAKDVNIKKFDQAELDQLGSLVDNMKNNGKEARFRNNSTNLTRAKSSDFNAVQEISLTQDESRAKPNSEAQLTEKLDTLPDQLEAKAFQMVLQDVINEEPDSLEKIQKLGVHTMTQLDTYVINHLKDSAK